MDPYLLITLNGLNFSEIIRRRYAIGWIYWRSNCLN